MTRRRHTQLNELKPDEGWGPRKGFLQEGTLHEVKLHEGTSSYLAEGWGVEEVTDIARAH